MERAARRGQDRGQNDIYEFVYRNAFGNPVIFQALPTSETMRGNTWGLWGTDVFIKFGNGVMVRLSGSKSESITDSTTLGEGHSIVLVDATDGAKIMYLPPLADSLDKVFTIKKMDVSANFVTINGNGSTIDGSDTLNIMVQYDAAKIVGTSSEWAII